MPSNQTSTDKGSYQTHRIQLLREITTRSGDFYGKDEDFVNVFIEHPKNKEASDNRQFVMKRAGTAKLIDSVAANEVRGMFYWQDQDKLLYGVGKNIYVYDVIAGTSVVIPNVFSTTIGDIGFTEYLYDTNVVVIITTDGTTLAQIDNLNVVTTSADPDLPVPHLPCPVFIDGYLFLAKADAADVYNSDLNNPLAFTPGNFLTAEMKGDLIVKITTLNNYLLVMGSESIEYFWDAANATGTPMQRNDTPIKMNTYLGGFCQYGNAIYYVGEDELGQPDVFRLKDFRIDNIGTPSVARYLNFVTEGSTAWRGGIIGVQGHAFYVLSVGGYTYVMDIENGLWTRWAFQQQLGFPLIFCSRSTTNTIKKSYFSLKGTDSSIYYFSDALFQDNGITFTCSATTEAADFGTMNKKTMSRLSLVGDRPTATSSVQVSWTDDDYQTWSTPKSINLDQDLPCTYRLGSFRQRAFKLEYTDNFPFRLQMLEVDINKGIN